MAPLSQHDIDTLLREGEALAEGGKLKKAHDCYQRILDQEPLNLRAIISVAALYRKDNRPNESLLWLEKYYDSYGFNPWVLKEKGHIYEALGYYEEALSYFSRAGTVDPSHHISEYFAVRLLLSLGREEEYRSRAAALIAAAKDDPWIALLQVDLAERYEGPDKAFEAASKVRQRFPDFSIAAVRCSSLLRRSGRTEEAKEVIDEYAATAPIDKWTHLESIEVSIARKAWKEALEKLSHPVLRDAPESRHSSLDTVLNALLLNLPLPPEVRELLIAGLEEAIPKLVFLLIRDSAERGLDASTLSSNPLFLNASRVICSSKFHPFLRTVLEHLMNYGQTIEVAAAQKEISFPQYLFDALTPALKALAQAQPRGKDWALFVCFFREYAALSDLPSYVTVFEEHLLEFDYEELFWATTFNLLAPTYAAWTDLKTHLCETSVFEGKTLAPHHLLFFSKLLLEPFRGPPAVRTALENRTEKFLSEDPTPISPLKGAEYLLALKLLSTKPPPEALRGKIIKRLHHRFPRLKNATENFLTQQAEIASPAQNKAAAASISPAKPRVALCISGQFRDQFPDLSRLKEEVLLGTECDIYIHSWKWVGVHIPGIHLLHTVFSGEVLRVLRQMALAFTIEKVWTFYPSLYSLFLRSSHQLDRREISRHYETSLENVIIEEEALPAFRDLTNQDKMYYKIKACYELCRASGKQYDLIIRVRPDLDFSCDTELDWPAITAKLHQERLIYTDGFPGYMQWMERGVYAPDKLAVGNPSVMGVYSNIYDLYRGFSLSEELYWPNHLMTHMSLAEMMWLYSIQMDQFPGISAQLIRTPPHFSNEEMLAAVKRDAARRKFFEWDSALIGALEQPSL